ncbi:FkbM family methyltransferase [Verticiella sediminum]|nr:FkbM family methyltransferase [Verticiella sediminum]
MGLWQVSPFRQMRRAYAGILRTQEAVAASERKLQASLQHLTRQVDALARQQEPRREEANGPAHVPQAPHALLPATSALTDVGLYERMGFRLLLDSTSEVDRCVIDSGSWEADQTRYFVQTLARLQQDRSVVFLDLGAYWGLYSLLAMRAGVQRIHAFDADPHNFAQLQAQIFLNLAATRITPHNLAISDAAGTLTFFDSRAHPDGNRGGVGVVGDDFPLATLRVPAVSIDEYLPLQDERIVIKMDLEGHEDRALAGLERTVKTNEVFMQVEVFEGNAQRILPVVERLGLRQVHALGVDRYFTNMP